MDPLLCQQLPFFRTVPLVDPGASTHELAFFSTFCTAMIGVLISGSVQRLPELITWAQRAVHSRFIFDAK